MKEQLINENKQVISNEGYDSVFGYQMRVNYSKLKELLKDLEY